MNFFSTATIRAKLALAFAAALALVVAAGLFGLLQLHSVNAVAREMREVWLPRIENLGKIQSKITEHRLLALRRKRSMSSEELAAIAQGMDAALAAMRPDAWLVNVARGRHVDTDALVAALTASAIGGAALDVTDPEPLPDGHPPWHLERCIITPHTADTTEMIRPLLARRIRDNVARFAAGEPLIGLVDPALGY